MSKKFSFRRLFSRFMNKKNKNKFEFVDLFSGIGGFHIAMSDLGGKCVLASDIDQYAIETYAENFKIDSNMNIRDLDAKDVPDHSVLCAGFPCQTFSKAGKQKGFNDETKGTLFFEIERILKVKHPKYIILENVRNLVTHDNGKTFKIIREHLKDCGYRLTKDPLILSPHQFGVPQLRERILIPGVYDPKHVDEPIEIVFDDLKKKEDVDFYSIIEKNADSRFIISEYEEKVLNAWDEFYKGIDVKVIGFPVWAEYFKQYPTEDMPTWKQDFIRKNNDLYNRNKDFIDKWLKKYNNLKDFVPTHRKFEWQCGTSINTIWEGLIQFRPSGIRVKVPKCFPALVAIVQIPIIGRYKRRLTVREAARLQCFPDTFIPNKNDQQAYKQFGNAVNIQVVKKVAEQLFYKY